MSSIANPVLWTLFAIGVVGLLAVDLFRPSPWLEVVNYEHQNWCCCHRSLANSISSAHRFFLYHLNPNVTGTNVKFGP